MFKKYLIVSMAVCLVIIVAVQKANAENLPYNTENIATSDQIDIVKDSQYTINVTDRLVDRNLFKVKTNQMVRLVLNNHSSDSMIFSMPMLNKIVEVPKNSRRIVDLDFTNPLDKEMWYQINQNGSNNRQGLFTVTDYPEQIVISMPSRSVTDLSSIINYQTESTATMNNPEPVYTTEQKAEPATGQEIKTGGYVRGYW